MPNVIETRATWGDFIKGVSAQFADVFDQGKNSYALALEDAVATPGNKKTALFKMLSTTKAQERTSAKTGVGYLSNTPEGQAFAMDSRFPGYTTTWVPQLYSNSVAVTLQAMKDRDYSQELDEFSDLTLAAKESMDRLAFRLFGVYGFTAQASVPNDYAQYGDAKPMFSTTHPRKDGGTSQSNASATGIPLSETNVEVGRLAMQAQLDDRGKPMRVGTGKLILLVPPALEKSAVIIAKGEKRSGTANNDINIYDGIFTVIASQYLSAAQGGSDTAWYLIDPRVAKLVFMTREGLQSSRHQDARTKAFTFDIYGRWVVGYGDWRGLWASKGDSAAYSG